MNYYVAPLEGITKSLYRRVHHRHFPGADKYFSPFLSPTRDYRLTHRERNELLPDREAGVPLVPQLLVKEAEPFLLTARELTDLGFSEINLNLGCPSRTVTAKKKGSGVLADPDGLDALLNDIFEGAGGLTISVKTRLGIQNPDEFAAFIPIFNRYPICELTVHARVQEDFYRRPACPEALAVLAGEIKAPLCYNGDILTTGDRDRIMPLFPTARAVMLGRGLTADPALIGKLKGEPSPGKGVYRTFHDELVEGLTALGWSQRAILCHMKEIWDYMGSLFDGVDDYRKPLRKSATLAEYQSVIERIFALPLRA